MHLSSSTSKVGAAIEDIGYSVRLVTIIIHKSTKRPLPIFFVDLEPAQINNEIFKLNSLLHTKIKVEEPHKRRTIIQCSNCQEYGHWKGSVHILLDVFVVPISISLHSVHNQKIYLQPMPYAEETIPPITVGVQSTKAYNVQISNQTQLLKIV